MDNAISYFYHHTIDSPSFEEIIFGLIKREVELLSDPYRTYTSNYQLSTLALIKLYQRSVGIALPTQMVKDLINSLINEAMYKETKDERERTKQSIVCGILNNENINQDIRNEIIESIVKDRSEKGFFTKLFSFFKSSKKIPKKLEELVCNLLQEQKTVLTAVFDDKDPLHETLKTFMDNFSSLREKTQGRIHVIREKLGNLVNQISKNTLSYSDFKLLHKMQEWPFKNGLHLIKGWTTGGYQSRDSTELYEEIQKMSLSFEDLKLAYKDIEEAFKKADCLARVANLDKLKASFEALKTPDAKVG